MLLHIGINCRRGNMTLYQSIFGLKIGDVYSYNGRLYMVLQHGKITNYKGKSAVGKNGIQSKYSPDGWIIMDVAGGSIKKFLWDRNYLVDDVWFFETNEK